MPAPRPCSSRQADEAAAEYETLVPAARATGVPELEVRALVGAGRTQMRLGAQRRALELLNEARGLVEAGSFSDLERAEVLCALGICRYLLSSVQTALALLNESLSLAERSGMPSDRSGRRSFRGARAAGAASATTRPRAKTSSVRCSSREDANDPRTIGGAYFQASLIADREGHWVLARNYAERARAAYEEVSDKVHVGQLTNNLGALNFLLGNPDKAIGLLKEAFGIALETGRDADAAQAVSSLAQIHLRTGNVDQAEEQARHALRLLEAAGNEDYVDEIGSAQLVLGRALLEQDRVDEAEVAFGAAEACFDQLGSAGHRASAWVARGDLAARRGDDRLAAHLFRTAAEALQDVRF